MRLNAVNLLGISITKAPKKEILEEIQKYLSQKRKKTEKLLQIVTPNAEQLVYAQSDSDFANILNRADIAIPDSIGVVWATRFLRKDGVEKQIPGVELMQDLVEVAAKEHVPVALIGGRGDLAVETLDCLQKKHPGLQGIAGDGPEIEIQNSKFKIQNRDENEYFSSLVKRLVDAKVQIIFVALGPPKQEYFMEKLSHQLLVIGKTDNRKPITDHASVVLMAVGGSFDIITGRLPRAPLLVRKAGLEWLWRLALEPWRIGRQLALLKFVWLVLHEKFRNRP